MSSLIWPFSDRVLTDEWHRVFIAGGVWPENLTDFGANNIHEFERAEWLQWVDLIGQFAGLIRIPAFADYTTTHPDFSKEPPEFANYSASIRYTCPEKYLLMRGESVFNAGGAGLKQYFAHASMLVKRPEFCGATFSYGDCYIKEKSDALARGDLDHPGRQQDWITASINHHITKVLHQIANLPSA